MNDIVNCLPSLEKIPCTQLKGVGSRVAEKLLKLGITSIQDLLFHLPLRYEDRTHLVPLRNLVVGSHVAVAGRVVSCEIKRGKRLQLVCLIRDASGFLNLRFFHFNAAQKQQLKPGSEIRCFGEVRYGIQGLEMIHPEYKLFQEEEIISVEEHLTPIYPTTEGLNQQSIRRLINQALVLLEHHYPLEELLPSSIKAELQMPSLIEAIKFIHHPPPNMPPDFLEERIHPSIQRLAFEELLAHQLGLAKMRRQIRNQHKAPSLNHKAELREALLRKLPFQLTGAQQRVYQEISHDLSQSTPMLRLVQGDVGSGKTIISALAALQAVENDFQAVIMAPTEILAEQHYKNFTQWLSDFDLTVTWLTGQLKAKPRRDALERIALGTSKVIVGTHALFQADVHFAKLGLVVIDEQHRFGVAQRLALHQKGHQEGFIPHQLIMTATPIPRTLAMSAYADLDHSIINELPPGRQPIQTVAISQTRRSEVIERVSQICAQGQQAYWVCTLIEESETLQCQAAEATQSMLAQALPHLKVGLVHGKMPALDKELIMQNFKEGKIDLLVATTVIEVGVDVPNASLIIIENPERLGLAQLHQLRGRVGRGKLSSFCVLLYQEPLSDHAKARIQVMRESNDGFVIAEKDLEIRGPGELLGTRQTGLVRMRIANIMLDKALLQKAKNLANTYSLDSTDTEKLIKRWIGNNEQYANV